MASAMIEAIEKSAEAQRAELARQFGQFRENIRVSSITRDLADGADVKANDLTTSAVALLARNPVPLAIIGSAALVLFAYRRRADRYHRSAPVSMPVREPASAIPRSSTGQRGYRRSVAAKMRETAEEVFNNWGLAVTNSIDRFAVEITRQLSQSLVRAGDAMIASGFERLAQSLSQMGK
jgi:hypothetical protein